MIAIAATSHSMAPSQTLSLCLRSAVVVVVVDVEELCYCFDFALMVETQSVLLDYRACCCFFVSCLFFP